MSAVALCFLLSGMGSLVLEVVWTRMLRLVFGSTTLAASTVLVAYMAGLGVGAWLGARLARRLANGVRAYGCLEIAIALYALGVPLALQAFPILGERWLYTLPFWGAAAIRAALSLALLAPPTICMGMTLPILVEATVTDRARTGDAIALLYGVNTLGAVAGVFGATFFFFPRVGLSGANYAGAALGFTAGLLALVLVRARARPTGVAAAAPEAQPGEQGRATAALVAYAVVGWSALVCEVAWTRLLAMVLGSSIYAFASMLGAFLAGIALGSLAARRWLDRISGSANAYALGIALFGALSLATFALVPALPGLFVGAVQRFGTSGGALTAVQVLLSLGLMLPPTLVLGALFPLLARSLAARGAGFAVGQVYFANTVGAALGAFSAGFVLIPTLGLRRTLGLAVALPFAASTALLLLGLGAARGRRLASATALGAVSAWLLVAPPGWDALRFAEGAFNPGRLFDPGFDVSLLDGVPAERLLYHRDGLNATVSVIEYRGARTLFVNGKPDASSRIDMPTQVLGQLPLLFGGSTRRVLVVGFASGVTVGSTLRHPIERLDVVELEPAALEASAYFDHVNGRPLTDPRLRVLLDDGRSVVAYGRERYDLVISEPSNPWFTGVANLFTQEYFAAVRRSLTPQGRLLQWIQLYAIDPPTLRAVLAALRAEFPHVYGFGVSQGVGDFFLLASLQPLAAADLPVFESLSDRVRSDLERVGVYSTADLWSLVRLVPDDLDRMLGEDPLVNRDVNLFVELRSPWNLYRRDVPESFPLIDAAGSGVMPLLEGTPEASDPEVLGELALAYARARHTPGIAHRLLARAEALGPAAHADATRAVLGAASGELDPDAELALLDRAVERKPEAPAVREVRARVRLARSDFEGALADADAVLAVRPSQAPVRLLRVQVLSGLGRFPEAAEESDRLLATEYAALDPNAWFFAGQSYLEVGRTADAVQNLARYVESEPGWHAAWGRLALAYERAGRAEDAARARRNQGRNLWILSRTVADSGDLARALALLRRGIELDPGYEPARETLTELEERWRKASLGAPAP